MTKIPVAALIAICSASPAFAQQTPGRVGGQVDKSVDQKKDPKEVAPKGAPQIDLQQQRPEMKSPDDAKVKLKVERYQVTGNTSVTTDEIMALLGNPGGREMSLAEIKAEAARVTELYRSRGLSLAWAYVPAQEVKGGAVEIAVVEGRVNNVLVQGNKHYSAEFILDHFGGIQRGGATDLDELERGLLTLNDYPGLSLRATLRQGDTPGSTDLYLTAQDKFPLTFSVDYDNFGAESVGESRGGAYLEVFNLWDLGHSVSLRGVTALNSSDGALGFGRAEYRVPFGSGSRVSVYGSFYDYEAEGDLAILEPTGTGTVYGAMVSHPFIRRHNLTLSAEIGFEAKDLEQQLIGITTAEDTLRVGILGVGFEWTDGLEGRWIVSGQLRQGLGEFAGGLEDDDPDASRLGADGDFTRVNAQIYRLQKVLDWFHLIGKGLGQYAEEELVVSEQFSVGGHDTVRGYPPFEFMGDRGYVATLEARIKAPFLADVQDPFGNQGSVMEMIQAAAFIDTGEAVLNHEGFSVRERQVLTGGGFGLRINYPDRISIRFDVAWPLTEVDPSNKDERFYYLNVILNLH